MSQPKHRCFAGHGQCRNPFHSWWWLAWRRIGAPAQLLGFAPMLVACRWTRTRCRIGFGFVGWDWS